MIRKFIFVLFLLVTCAGFAETGDELIVHSNIVNLREGPSTDHAVVLKLEKGKKLFEIRREGKWVEVKTRSTQGTTGWIHSSLVRKGGTAGPAKTLSKEDRLKLAFAKFKPEFDAMNARLELENGSPSFIEIKYIGNGVVQVTATETWIDFSQIRREKHLAEIFKMWNAKADVGLSVSVEIIDDEDERFMVMFR